MKTSGRFVATALVLHGMWIGSLNGAEPLVVGPGSTVQLGDPAQQTTLSYSSVTVEGGGTLDIQGYNTTLQIDGDLVLDGTISMTPQDKAPAGPDGQDGANGAENQPTGQNVGLSGSFPGTAPASTNIGPRLTLSVKGSAFINGTIRIEPAFDGGDGGRGGNGGNGGSGSSPDANKDDGAIGGFGSQGGQGGTGGRANGSVATLRILADEIDVAPSGRISLDNKGVGGKGGRGGNAGHGGKGGNGVNGGNGGRGGDGSVPGSGGTGGDGASGGSVQLIAKKTVTMDGEISVKGGTGGDGGTIGDPGNGGLGGDAGPNDNPAKHGGNGGNGGGPFSTGGFTGGKGGWGGAGGTVLIQGSGWSIGGIIHLDGGFGGQGGPGVPAGRGQGADGGSPGGNPGTDSMLFPDGADGQEGPDGTVYFVLGGVQWEVGEPLECIEGFTESADGGATLSGIQMCGGNCLSRYVSTDPAMAYELTLDYRWLSTMGTLEFRLGGELFNVIAAPEVLTDQFEPARILITDTNLLDNFFQELQICLEPDGPALVQVANIFFRPVPRTNTPPIISIHRGQTNGSVEFTWQSSLGTDYRLQVRTSLTAGSWSNTGPLLPGTGANMTTTSTVPAGQPETYYRIVASPPTSP